MPERRALIQSFRVRPRCCDFVIGQIYAVGGLTKTGESVSTVEIYDPVTKTWRMGKLKFLKVLLGRTDVLRRK